MCDHPMRKTELHLGQNATGKACEARSPLTMPHERRAAYYEQIAKEDQHGALQSPGRGEGRGREENEKECTMVTEGKTSLDPHREWTDEDMARSKELYEKVTTGREIGACCTAMGMPSGRQSPESKAERAAVHVL